MLPRHTDRLLRCARHFSSSQVRAASLSASPTFRAAAGRLHGEATRGLALRFPRFIRERTDKAPRDATTAEELAHLFAQQPEAAGAVPAAAAAATHTPHAGGCGASEAQGAALESLSRRELQQRAKAAGVRANLKSTEIIAWLRERGDA